MKKLFLFFLLWLILLGFFSAKVEAATFSFDPQSRKIKVGEPFQVKIILDTQEKMVNGVQALISYSKDFLSVKSINFSALFPSNFQSIQEDKGQIHLGSGEDLPTNGYKGKGDWVIVSFEAKNKGVAELRFSCFDSSILEVVTTNNLLDCGVLTTGSYSLEETVEGKTEPTSTPGPAQGTGCQETSPATPQNLKAVSGPDDGQVTLSWIKISGATHYSLVFGQVSRNYQYGAANIGETNQYVVKALIPGKLYYFAIAAVRGCASSGFSEEVSARAKLSKTGPGVTLTPIPTPIIYRPIGEIFSGSILPSPPPTPSPEPTPTPVPQKSRLGFPSQNTLLILFGLIIFLGVVLMVLVRFWRRRRPPLPTSPTIVLPPQSPSPLSGSKETFQEESEQIKTN